MKNDYKRFLTPKLLDNLNASRIVLLNGARQVGKTTLLKALDKTKFTYRTLDNPVFSETALSDPISFLTHNTQTLIIDEIQRIPDLLLTLKMHVDENRQKGQFILSGSADVTALPDAKESLAGRIQKIRLRTLSQAEILQKQSTFLEAAFTEKGFNDDLTLNKSHILERAFMGGYPEVLSLDIKYRSNWFQSYVDAIMTRDLQDIIQIKRFDAMRELLAILASWSSKFMDISSIASSIAISRPTLETYINILNIMYMCDRVPAWLGSDYERIAKHDKIFMADCGLMAALLDWNIDNVLLDSDRSGKLVETFIYNELASLIDFADEKYSLYHYRDRTKREIDFIIKRHKDNSLLGIEVKSGSNVTSDAFKHLRWFKENLVDDKTKFIGMVLYSGQHYLAYKDNMHLVPISALWNG